MQKRLTFDRGLVLNVGSSSVKWSLLTADGADVRGALAQRSGVGGAADSLDGDAAAAVREILPRVGRVDAVGHRIVHGGTRFSQAARVDDEARRALDELVALDPLHMLPALALLDAARAAWPDAVHVAAFDTAFHATLSPEASAYAVPSAWRDALAIRRYGFHGLSVEHAVHRAGELLGGVPARLVVAHLGSGCSVTAVRDGRSVDTTMGMTPLEGLVMGTRSGTINPSIPLLAQRRLGLDAAACERALTHDSGLAGLSGGTSELRDLRAAAAAGSALAAHACRVFELSVRRGVGAMLGSLGGLDAIVFTGGIGEHDEAVRRDCLEALSFLGLDLDAGRNAEGGDRRIDGGAGRPAALVVEAREDITIARAMSAGSW